MPGRMVSIKHHRLALSGEPTTRTKQNGRHLNSNRPLPTQCFPPQRMKECNNPETSRPHYWLKRADGKGYSVGPYNQGFDLRMASKSHHGVNQCSTDALVTEMARNSIHDAALQPTITLSSLSAEDIVTGVFIHHGATDLHHRRVSLNITSKEVRSEDAGSSSRTRRCGWSVATVIQAIHGWALRSHPPSGVAA